MKQFAKIGLILLMGWILLPVVMRAEVQPAYAGATIAEATETTEATTLLVRDGSNYIKLNPKNLPAVISYTSDSTFGPLPTLIVDGEDTIPGNRLFVGCSMQWQWTIEKEAEIRIVNIETHENASIFVDPHQCQTSYSDTTATVCGGIEWNGVWRDASGDYTVTLDNAEGCDSIRTLHLTVYTSVDADTTAEVWDSITWYGTTYRTSGDHTIELKDEHECDYSYTLHLTVHTTSYDTTSLSGCDSIVFDGLAYTESGTYLPDTTTTIEGDRTIRVLELIIRQSSSSETTLSSYEPYTSPSGKIYTESGDYTDTISNIAGCDSIISIHLTVYETRYDTIEPMTGCDSIVYEGKTYTRSIAYNDTTIAGDGNRTITTVTMTIHYTTYGEESVTKNGSYTSPRGITYTESGDYEEKTTNAAGCDSIITLHITIGDVTYDTVYFCRGYNHEHEVKVTETLIRRYLPYTYEAPSSFDYREGMILERRENQVLVDFNIAEANLRGHYANGLTPIVSITWSIRYPGAGAYEPIIPEAGPQWLNYGLMAIQIQFRCGETYNDALPMGVEETETAQRPIKRIENGQVVIIRGGAAYTLTGQRIED